MTVILTKKEKKAIADLFVLGADSHEEHICPTYLDNEEYDKLIKKLIKWC